jgi:hypothetical protein
MYDYHVHEWMYGNFIALMMYYRINNFLKKSDLLRRYSPENVLEHLGHVNMLEIGLSAKCQRFRRSQATPSNP